MGNGFAQIAVTLQRMHTHRALLLPAVVLAIVLSRYDPRFVVGAVIALQENIEVTVPLYSSSIDFAGRSLLATGRAVANQPKPGCLHT